VTKASQDTCRCHYPNVVNVNDPFMLSFMFVYCECRGASIVFSIGWKVI